MLRINQDEFGQLVQNIHLEPLNTILIKKACTLISQEKKKENIITVTSRMLGKHPANPLIFHHAASRKGRQTVPATSVT